MFLLFVCVPHCFVYSSEGRKEGVHHLLNESWPRLEGVISPFFSGELVGRRHQIGFGACLSFVGKSDQHWFTVAFLLEPRASDSKPIK